MSLIKVLYLEKYVLLSTLKLAVVTTIFLQAEFSGNLSILGSILNTFANDSHIFSNETPYVYFQLWLSLSQDFSCSAIELSYFTLIP